MKIHRPLFDLLYGSPDRVRQAAAAIGGDGSWAETIRLAEAWRVLPRLTTVVREHRLELTSSSTAALRSATTRHAMKSGYVARRAGELAQALEEKGIEAVAFKGVATLARLHRSPAERMLSDIDLMVHEPDLERALKAIQGVGFALWIDGSLDDQRQFSERRVRKENYSVNLIDAEGLEVDLHYRLRGWAGQILGDGLWLRAGRVPLMGRPIAAVSPVDAILLITHHALRNQLCPYPTLRDLGDLAGYWQGCGATWAVSELATLAKGSGLGAPLLGLCRILEEAGTMPAGDRGLATLREALGGEARTEGDRLGEWFFELLEQPTLGGERMADLFILLADPMSLPRLLRDRLVERRRSAGTPWRRKTEELRERLAGSDTGRARGLITSLAGLNRRQMRGLWWVVRAQRRAFAPPGDAHPHDG